MNGYYADLKAHDYESAAKTLSHNKLIQKNRNALLYNLEMGRLARLQNDYMNSNMYLNRADNMIESNRKSLGDIAVGNLINPMHETYRGEDFEQFMMHYYKALNYAALGQTEDAVVEARRITLSSDAQGDKFRNKETRYSKDAFALNLQGMIYEMAGDINNAFISYRNAAETYKTSGMEYYGVTMPQQLRNDLVRTAGQMGFSGDQQQFEKMYNVSYADTTTPSNGELVLFLEEGQAPVKEERSYYLTATSNGIGSFNYVDAYGLNSDFNFNYNSYGIGSDKLSSLRVYTLALPYYHIQYNDKKAITVSNSGNEYRAQLAQDLNNVAVNVLKERFLKEMGNALARQLTKKVVEKGTQAVAESIAKSNDKVDKNASEEEKAKQQKKNDENAKRAGQVVGLLTNLVNTATEKADTRNWQSLPAYVSYVRIPLTEGENTITITSNGNPKTIKVNSAKGLQMLAVAID